MATLAAMVSAAVVPVALAVMAGASGDAAAALVNLGGGVGGNYFTSWLYAMVERIGGDREVPNEVLRDILADELAAAMEGTDEQAALLRAEAVRILDAVDAIHVVLKYSTDEQRQALVTVLGRIDDLPVQMQGIATQLATTLHGLRAEWWQESRQSRRLLHRLIEQSDAQLELLRQFSPARVVPEVAGREPYPGLAGFSAEDAGLFFGRDELVAKLRTRLLDSSVCLVTGESGSGKSSLLRAGLTAGLARSPYDPQRSWRLVHWSVADHPVVGLATALAPALSVPSQRIAAAVEAGDGLANLLSDRPFDQRLVIVADQFERIFTRCGSRERDVILRALLMPRPPDHPMATVLSIRADFLPQCVAEPQLSVALEDEQIIVGPMDAADLRAAVELPVRAVGLSIEPALVAEVTAAAERWPRSLPLVAHAMREVWKRRTSAMLRVRDYHAIGGLAGAIRSTADAALRALTDEAQRTLARKLLTQCVDIDPDRGTHTSRPLRRNHVEALGAPKDVRNVLERLRSAAVISLGDDNVELTHEALITAWPSLAEWVEEDGEYIRIRSRLRRAAREWATRGRHGELLYGERGIAEVDSLLQNRQPQLDPQEVAFVEAGRAVVAQRATEREAFKAQQEVVRTIQRALLPDRLPFLDGICIAVRYMPGSGYSEVGGDWYETIANTRDQLLLVVGDVAGSGLEAVPLMVQLRVVTRAYAIVDHEPDKILRRMDEYVRRFPEKDGGATAFVANLSAKTRELHWSSAAHGGALLWDPALPDMPRWLNGRKGPVLGSSADAAFPLNSCSLSPGSRLLVFTAGWHWRDLSADLEATFIESCRAGNHIGDTVDDVAVRLASENDLCVVGIELDI